MRKFKYLWVLFWILSCNSKDKEANTTESVSNSTERKVLLDDSLGGFTLFIPDRYDTMFSWVHRSDCGAPCNTRKIRFQSTSLPIHKESGFIWTDFTDSIDRLTISYPEEVRIRTKAPELGQIEFGHSTNVIQLKSDYPEFTLKSDTIRLINNKYYSFVVLEEEKNTKRKIVYASLDILGNEIKFCYEVAKGAVNDSVYVDFVKNAETLLSTIKTEK
ncbi:MAG: hypothetical protein JNM88_21545 [Chitinophagaceae bacterium]|nr:hypothetical protein [Chitinophagaceae bacterium]